MIEGISTQRCEYEVTLGMLYIMAGILNNMDLYDISRSANPDQYLNLIGTLIHKAITSEDIVIAK